MKQKRAILSGRRKINSIGIARSLPDVATNYPASLNVVSLSSMLCRHI